MSRIKEIAGKAAQKTVAITLTTGVIISVGLLGYCGMLVISPSLVLAYAAFVLAGLVDGEVFWQNINNGMKELALLGPNGLRTLIVAEIDKRLDTLNGLDDYKKCKNYLAAFENKRLTKEQREAKKQATKTLHRMQKVLVAQILSKNCPDNLKLIRNNIESTRKKLWFIWLGTLISGIAGAAFGFATASSLSTALVTITPALAAAIWPLAAIACIGYTFLIYHTITDIIRNDTIAKWRAKISKWFNNEKWYHSAAVGLILFTGITVGILATLATAGTWWLAVKHGAQLLPGLGRFASNIRNILVPVAASANLIFVIRNTLTSTKHLITFRKKATDSSTTKTTETVKKEKKPAKEISPWQRFNPFRLIVNIIKMPFLLLVFIAHLAAVGLTGDRAPGLNYSATIASAVFGALSDGFVDFHYIFHLLGHEHEHHDEKGHKHNHEHAHDHGLIANALLNVALSPILLLSAAWDYTTSKITLADSLRANFGIKKSKSLTPQDEPKTPIYSKETQTAIIKHRLEKQITRLEATKIGRDTAKEKIVVLRRIVSNLDAPTPTGPLSDKERAILSTRRSLFGRFFTTSTQTTTIRAVDKLCLTPQATTP